jgi:hypothetical protein
VKSPTQPPLQVKPPSAPKELRSEAHQA